MSIPSGILPLLRQRWYVQAFNGTPLCLSCGNSGFDLDESLGDHFRAFLYDFREEYGKMYYGKDDLERLCSIIRAKMKADPLFLKNIKKKYDITFRRAYGAVDVAGLSSCSDREILGRIEKAAIALRVSVGQAHLIEGFSLTTDEEIRTRLKSKMPKEAALDEALFILSAPVEPSFIQAREMDLRKIADIKNIPQRRKAALQHIKEYSWVRNSYAGSKSLTEEEVLQELETRQQHPFDAQEAQRKKREMLEKVQPDPELHQLLEITAFMTTWQDERKRNIYQAIGKMELLIGEFSQRCGISKQLLRYLYPVEFASLPEHEELLSLLLKRRQGCIVAAKDDGSLVFFTGEEYKSVHRQLEDLQKNKEASLLQGISASSGTAIGKVKICRSLKDIDAVKEGDILVTSMTRPESLPAMKKAAAIVTDEGGITCHAAIVAREMGKPCIIATKNATTILKDGMRVEVKANHGVVRVLP